MLLYYEERMDLDMFLDRIEEIVAYVQANRLNRQYRRLGLSGTGAPGDPLHSPEGEWQGYTKSYAQRRANFLRQPVTYLEGWTNIPRTLQPRTRRTKALNP